jgi:sporulation protein YlmC with PRC-barrel domain
MKNKALYTTLLIAGLQTLSFSTHAEVVGSTVIGVSVSEVSEIASGWSVKNSILNKPIYNELGNKIGRVNDLIIAPNKSLSYVIIGAGGFLGMGKYDVAIPVTQINEVNGKMELRGATKESVKQMPQFKYATYTANKDAYVASAEKDIQKGREKLSELNKEAMSDKTEIKAKISTEVLELQQQIKNAETKLLELKNATEKKWRDYQAGVNAAIASIRKHF